MNRIRQLRKLRNLTQQEVGEYLGFGNTAISMYECDRRHLDDELIHKLCTLFNCSADYLIGLSDYVEPIITKEDARHLKAYHAASDKERRIVDFVLQEYDTDE